MIIIVINNHCAELASTWWFAHLHSLGAILSMIITSLGKITIGHHYCQKLHHPNSFVHRHSQGNMINLLKITSLSPLLQIWIIIGTARAPSRLRFFTSFAKSFGNSTNDHHYWQKHHHQTQSPPLNGHSQGAITNLLILDLANITSFFLATINHKKNTTIIRVHLSIGTERATFLIW